MTRNLLANCKTKYKELVYTKTVASVKYPALFTSEQLGKNGVAVCIGGK